MLDVIKMGRWLDLNDIFERAKNEALFLSTRWDVPQGKRKPGQSKEDKELYIEVKKGDWRVLPKDQRDINGRYFRTAPDPVTGRQEHISGRMLVDDLMQGSFPASLPLLFGFLSLLGCLNSVVMSTWVSPVLVLLMIPVIVLISTATESFKWGAAAVGLSVALPITGMTMVGGSVMHAIGGGGIPALIGFGALIGLAVLFGGLRGARVAVGVVIGLVVIVLIASHTPEFLRPFVLAIPGALLPAAWALQDQNERARQLVIQARKSIESSNLPLSHVEGREEQAKRTAMDDSPFITYGHATGRLTLKWDGWASDGGLPFGQTVRDLATHIIIFGSTGRGKTVQLLIPIIVAFIKAQAGGVLVMDGKGALPSVFRKLLGYVTVDPSKVIVALYQGMTSAEVSRTLRELNVVDDSQDEAKMWNDLAYNLCRHSAAILEALCLISKDAPASGKTLKWTMRDHYQLAVLALEGADAKDKSVSSSEDDKAGTTLHTYLDLVQAHHPEGRDGLLAEARHYFLQFLPTQESKTRSGIMTTLDSWMSPIMGHKELLPWATAETGVVVEDCLRGAKMGFNLPSTRYGRAGQAAQQFLKNRVFNGIRKRAEAPEGKWWVQDPEAKPLLMAMDECQAILSDADAELAPQCRSLGLWMVACTQAVESIRQTGKNANKIEAFLDAFQSAISLSSSPATFEWLSKRFGNVWTPPFSGKTQGIDFIGSAIAAIESPLFDPKHPLKRWMQMFRRRGAGGFKPLQEPVGSIDADMSFELRTTSGQWEEKPLLSRAEFSNLTAKQGLAIAMVMRSGSPRRDYIRLDQLMDELPAEMCDPNYVEPESLYPELDALFAAAQAAEVPMGLEEPEEVEVAESLDHLSMGLSLPLAA